MGAVTKFSLPGSRRKDPDHRLEADAWRRQFNLNRAIVGFVALQEAAEEHQFTSMKAKSSFRGFWPTPANSQLNCSGRSPATDSMLSKDSCGRLLLNCVLRARSTMYSHASIGPGLVAWSQCSACISAARLLVLRLMMHVLTFWPALSEVWPCYVKCLVGL